MLVGPQQKRFTIHKHIISARSTFFESAFSGRWTEASNSKTIELPEHDVNIFDIYLRCVYNNNVKIRAEIDILGDNDNKHAALEKQLIRAWILADKLGDVAAANLLIDEMISHSD